MPETAPRAQQGGSPCAGCIMNATRLPAPAGLSNDSTTATAPALPESNSPAHATQSEANQATKESANRQIDRNEATTPAFTPPNETNKATKVSPNHQIDRNEAIAEEPAPQIGTKEATSGSANHQIDRNEATTPAFTLPNAMNKATVSTAQVPLPGLPNHHTDCRQGLLSGD